jgi:hypothetical protein
MKDLLTLSLIWSVEIRSRHDFTEEGGSWSCACCVFSRTVAWASKLQATSKPVEGNLFVLMLSHELDASFPPRANSSLIMLFSSRIISNLILLVHINRLSLGHFKDTPHFHGSATSIDWAYHHFLSQSRSRTCRTVVGKDIRYQYL